MKPLVPFVSLPELVLCPAGFFGADSPPLSIKPFGLLVALGVYVGAFLALQYGARRGLYPRALGSFIVWVVGCGFVFGHVFDVLFYTPERIRSEPLVLLKLWDGLSSYGGFAGGLLGALLWKQRHGEAVLPYADAVASALPAGWLFGRAGCAVVHDHPGIPSEVWFAVAYPDGGRLDLGLLEMLSMLPIVALFLWLRRRAWPRGFFVALLCVLYAPLRFLLDFWRIREPSSFLGMELLPDRRYADLTPAQWASLGLWIFGCALLVRVLKRARDDGAFAIPPVPRAFQSRVRVLSDTNP